METAKVSQPTESTGRFKNANLTQAWLVLLLALFFGAALATVQVQLSDIIAANKLNETLAQVPGLIWGETTAAAPQSDASVQITPGTAVVKKNGKSSAYQLYRVAKDNQVKGWVIKASGQGYADKVEVLIGVDADLDRITGLFVLEQKETPGLGNKITFPEWRSQFVGKQTDTLLQVIKDDKQGDHTIDAITGATISSRSVTTIVNTTIGNLKGELDSEGKLFSERPVS